MTSHLTKGSIEFLTIALETCKYIESDYLSATDFIDKMRKLLPLIYLKASTTELPPKSYYDDEPERFVNEKDYEDMREKIANILGTYDQYLTAIHPDISMSENTIVANISEDIADLYQNLKDFISIGKIGNEELLSDALMICLTEFKNYWGAKLLNAELALHLLWSQDKEVDQDTPSETKNQI